MRLAQNRHGHVKGESSSAVENVNLTFAIGVGSKRIVRRCNGFTPIIPIGFSPIIFTGSRIPTRRI